MKEFYKYLIWAFKYIIIPILVILSLIAITGTLYFKIEGILNPTKLNLHSIGLQDYLKETDIASLFTALITFAIVIFITFRLERDSRKRQIAEKEKELEREKEKMELEKKRDDEHEALMIQIKETVDQEFKKLGDVTERITVATGELQDASRKILDNFPEILDKAIEIVKTHRGKKGQLYVLNFTSLFGKVHTYNKSILKQHMRKNLDRFNNFNDPQKEDYELAINEMCQKIADLEEFLIKRTQELENIQISVLSSSAEKGKNLKDIFIEKYYEGNTENLIMHEMKKGRYYFCKEFVQLSKEEVNSWKNHVVIEHNKSLMKLWNARNDLDLSTDDYIKYTEYVPLQMYLGENFTGTEERDRECLIIFVNNSNVGKGEIMGVYSRNSRMFAAFKFIFDDIFKDSKPIKSSSTN